jgi:YHS domain-containing protein
MSPKHLLMAVLLLCCSAIAVAGTYINTAGSEDGTAISGFDTVAFFTVQRALKGKAEFSFKWAGAKWLFASEENMELFKAAPDKYAPQYGGHCAWCVSENCICGRPANGAFEIIEGKLYLFPVGNKGNYYGTKNAWWNTGGGPQRRIPNSDRFWLGLKEKLEAQDNGSRGPLPIENPGGGMNGVR